MWRKARLPNISFAKSNFLPGYEKLDALNRTKTAKFVPGASFANLNEDCRRNYSVLGSKVAKSSELASDCGGSVGIPTVNRFCFQEPGCHNIGNRYFHIDQTNGFCVTSSLGCSRTEQLAPTNLR